MTYKTVKVAFDVGGVLSKYPEILRPIVHALGGRLDVEVFVISDMHPVEQIVKKLRANQIEVKDRNVRSASFQAHGDRCKEALCEELGIDVLIDDYPGYVGTPGKPPLRLLVMPDTSKPYYSPDWRTDGSEGDFGQRKSKEGS